MKKLTALAAAIILLASVAQYSDTPEHSWYYDDVARLSALGIISGFPDGSFRPSGSVTRAEFCKLFTLAVNGEPDEAGGDWHSPYTGWCAARGLIDADADLGAPMPKIEAAVMLSRHFADVKYPDTLMRLSEYIADFGDIGRQYALSALQMMYLGLIVGAEGGAYRPTAAITRAEAATVIARILWPERRLPRAIPALAVDTLSAAQTSEQIITVTAGSLTDSGAVLNMYEKIDGVWLRTQRDLPAVIGSRGMQYARKQNSYKTPAGYFGFVFAFGAQDDPGVGTGWNYRKITPQSYWVLDSSHESYNRWVEGRGSFKSHERLQDFGYQYDYAMVIDFNYESPVKGDGGAIFMHIATDDGKATAGCVALSREHLLAIMLVLDPAKNPRIIICPEGDLGNF